MQVAATEALASLIGVAPATGEVLFSQKYRLADAGNRADALGQVAAHAQQLVQGAGLGGDAVLHIGRQLAQGGGLGVQEGAESVSHG